MTLFIDVCLFLDYNGIEEEGNCKMKEAREKPWVSGDLTVKNSDVITDPEWSNLEHPGEQSRNSLNDMDASAWEIKFVIPSEEHD